MKAKDKATQLIYAFEAFTDNANEYKFAIQCALIAVDEIINALEYLDDDSEYFWEEVKRELQNL